MAQEIGIRIYKRENSEKWRPSRLCHFTSARQPALPLWWRPCSHGHCHGNPGDERAPHQVNKVALNDVRKRWVKKNKRGGQRVLLGREIEGLDLWGRRGEDREGGKMRDTEQKTKKRKKGGSVRACWMLALPREQMQKHHLSLSLNHYRTHFTVICSLPSSSCCSPPFPFLS